MRGCSLQRRQLYSKFNSLPNANPFLVKRLILKRSSFLKQQIKFVVFIWKGIYSGSDTNMTGAEGLSFYYQRLLLLLLKSDAGSGDVELASGFVIQNCPTLFSM